MPTDWLPCPGNTNATPICSFSLPKRQKHWLCAACQVEGDRVTKHKGSSCTLLRLTGHVMSELVTDEDLARARQDPEFRQRFYAEHLDRLLAKLNQMRKAGNPDPQRARQIKEGV